MYKAMITAALAAAGLSLPSTTDAKGAAPRVGIEGDAAFIRGEKLHQELLARMHSRERHGPDSGISTVTIENGTTTNMSCSGQSPIVCSPTGTGAVLSTSDLENYLATSSVTVTTNGSGGSQVADINVESQVSWSAATTLTLDADQSVNVTAPLLVSGTSLSAGLSFITNDGGSGGYLTFASGGYASFSDMTNSLSENGAAYTLVNSIAALSSAVASNPYGNFALGTSYSASGKYKSDPIETEFFGSFEGLGNSISNLDITDKVDGYVGLFKETYGAASIVNLNLVGANVAARGCNVSFLGALVGENRGTSLYNDTVSGKVSGLAGCEDAAGGLVGDNAGTIIGSASSVGVTWKESFVGGLVGTNEGTVQYSSAIGSVSGSSAGGLVGANEETGEIENSIASGSVTASCDCTTPTLGGLVGGNNGLISLSSASGSVSSGSWDNGLGGSAASDGGLVGQDAYKTAIIMQSFATGNVSASNKNDPQVGGLIGSNGTDGADSPASTQDSYALGSVTCDCGQKRSVDSAVGGFVGDRAGEGIFSSTYSTGAVAQGKYTMAYGFGGGTGCYMTTSAYWDVDTSGTMQDNCGATPQTTSQLTSGLPIGFDPTVWTYDPTGQINGGFPYLICNPPAGTQLGAQCQQRPSRRSVLPN